MTDVPKHIAFILDGNRRWAKAQGMQKLLGHKIGINNVTKILDHAVLREVKIVTMFCFSKENWNRSKSEVSYLFRLFSEFFENTQQKLIDMDAKVIHLGELAGLPEKLQEDISEMVEKTREGKGLIVQFALNYSGQDEIARAVNRALDKGQEINVENISSNLDSFPQAFPDMIVRTSGEQRLSGFLTWQSAYSELYFPCLHWPDFDENEFDKAIAEYQRRNRRFGK